MAILRVGPSTEADETVRVKAYRLATVPLVKTVDLDICLLKAAFRLHFAAQTVRLPTWRHEVRGHPGAMCPEGLIPDAVALLSHADTEIWVAIEFRVSHPKAIEDVRKYATVDFPVMEISITDDIANAEDTRKSLAERITGTGHATRFAGREWLYSPAAKKILKRSWHIEAEPSAKPLRHKGTDLIRLETPLPAITVYAVKGAPTGETSWDNIDLTLREISEATVEKQEEALRKKRSLSSRCPSYKNGAPAGRQIKQTKDTGFETPTKPHGILGRLKGLFDKFRK